MQYGPTFDDGRGRYSDHIGMAAPRGMRAAVRQAALTLGVTSAAFMRDAIDARLQAYVKQTRSPAIMGGGCSASDVGQEAQ